MKNRLILALAALTCAGLACSLVTGAKPAPVTADSTPLSAGTAAVEVYDPARDPNQDLQRAVAAAQQSGKRVLVEVGGDWCIWCHHMDDFYQQNPGLLSLRERYYILVKVNFSDENPNAAFFSHYPPIPGYPHIFVFDSDGQLVHSQ